MILLVAVNAKYVHSNPAVYYLRSYCITKAKEEYGDDSLMEAGIEIAEFNINRIREEVLREIYLKKPQMIAFSCYLWNIAYVKALIGDLHKILPEVDIWLGGPEVSFDANEYLEKFPFLRGIMSGEGEKSFYRVAKHYLVNKEDGASNVLANIQTNADVNVNTDINANVNIDANAKNNFSADKVESLPRILYGDEDMDFDDVPFPYDNLDNFKNRIIYYETSRGCPFKCEYCLSSVDRRVRLRNIELVKKELKIFLDAKVPQVKFVDRTFNCNKAHTMQILEFIKANDNGITNFHFEMAAELISEDEIEIMNSLRPGQIQLEIGVQTTNLKTLEAINRKSDIDKLRKIVERLREGKNMHLHLDLIAGLPYEDLISFRKSFNDVYSMKPDDLQLGFLKILKGSPMEKRVEEYGIVYSFETPYEVLSTKWISFDDLMELKGVEEMLEVYHNSGQFTCSLEILERLFETPYDLYYALSLYYAKKNYQGLKLNRYDRYKILREFFMEYAEAQAVKTSDETVCEEITLESFTEKLLKDLYLRENLKSRPEYGEAGLVASKELREFFEKGRYSLYIDEKMYEGYNPIQIMHMVHVEKIHNGYELYDYKVRDKVTENARCVYVLSLT